MKDYCYIKRSDYTNKIQKKKSLSIIRPIKFLNIKSIYFFKKNIYREWKIFDQTLGVGKKYFWLIEIDF